MRPTIAAFDCDGTLIRGDATHLFLLSLQGKRSLLLMLLRLSPQLVAWRIGQCSTGEMKERLIDAVLQATPVDHRRHVLEEVLPQALRRQIRPEALNRLHWHQQQGHRCLIITASPEPLIRPLADWLGVELISTRCSDPIQASRAHPFKLLSANCKGPEKLHRLQEALGTLPLPSELESYGDSRGDRELLNASEAPHYRSFTQAPQPYRNPPSSLQALLPLLALTLLSLGLRYLLQLPKETLIALGQAGERLLLWLPLIYGLLTLSYLGRYWRWRLLLSSVNIGHWSGADALGWFRGFALTATPGKMGELSRVNELHERLGYPRPALMHAFLAERLCDGGAVLLWLLLLTPSFLEPWLQKASKGWSLGGPIFGVFLAMGMTLALIRSSSRIREYWSRLRNHMPKRAMARACISGLGVSVLFWGTEALILWILVSVLTSIPFTPIQGIRIYLLSGTAGLLSNIPGGIGINEAATTLLLQNAGIDFSMALPISILRRIVTIWSVTVAAALTRQPRQISIRSMKH